MTGPELDAHLKCIQPCIGVWHWAQDVSSMKLVIGQEYWELQKVFIAAINGGIPPPVLYALHFLLDFIFQAQNLLLYNETLLGHVLSKAI